MIEQSLFPVKEYPACYAAGTLAKSDDNQDFNSTGYKFIVRDDTGEVISCVTDSYKLIRNQEVVDATLPAMKELGAKLSAVEVFSNARTSWKFTLPDKVKIAKDDWVNPEVTIKNSYDGSCELQAFGGAYRLVCSNGLVIGYALEKKSQRHIIGSMKNIEDIPFMIESVILATKQVFTNEFPLLVDTKLNSRHIPTVMKEFPTQVMESLTQSLLGKRPRNYWDLLNCATWVATHAMKRNVEATHKLEMKLYPLVMKLAKSANRVKA